MIFELTCCDLLYIGGGNARKIAPAPPPPVKLVSNVAGVTGGARLWEPECDVLLAGEPNAFLRPAPS